MRLSWLTFELETVKKEQHRVASKGDMWTRGLMRLMADFVFETFENHRILAPLSKAKDTMERGRSGRKSYVMRFLKTQGNIERGYVDTGSHEAHGRLCS